LKKPVNYIEAALRKKLGRPCTAEEYIAANGIGTEEYGGEQLAEVPRRLRRAIERLAEGARLEAAEEAAKEAAELDALEKIVDLDPEYLN
jgi:hypothetical protein